MAIAAVNASRRGEDPRKVIGQQKQPQGISLNDVWGAYKKAGFPKIRGVGRKRDSTIDRDVKRFDLLIRKSIGSDAAASIDTARVRRWLDGIPTEGQRSHGLVMLKSILSFADSRGLCKVQPIGITAPKSKEVQNSYKSEQLAALDNAIVSLIAEKPSQLLSFSALRLLIATGARLGEILSLRWHTVDLEHGIIALERDKTSENRRDILLTPEAVEVLKRIPRTASAFVFQSDSRAVHLMDLKKSWLAALSRAGLHRCRIHDLRHSFASAGIRQGVSLYTMGKLLGHRQATTTQRYAHLERDVARAALDRIAAVTKYSK